MDDYYTAVECPDGLVAIIPIGSYPHSTWSSFIIFKTVVGSTINLKNVGTDEQDYTIFYLTIYK